MNPRERVQKYGPWVAAGLVVIWAVLCFLVVISPRLKRLKIVSGDLKDSQAELKQITREIEDARIAGAPVPGTARFEKFGILARKEEQLFYADLIAYCKETNNTLNLIRRSEYSRRAPVSQEEAQASDSGGQTRSRRSGGQPEAPRIIIDRVPHMVTFSGTFLSSFYLLRKLESYKRLLTVERVDLATDSRVGYPQLNGNITVELYLVRRPISEPEVEDRPAAAEAAGAEAAAAEPASAT